MGRWLAVCAATLLLAACSPTPPETAAPRAGGAPVSVTLVTAREQDLPVTVEASGTIAARRSVDLRPQVAAMVREVLVREGDLVRQGQALFRLDDRQERAQLERARAQLLRDEAALADAQRQLQRAQELHRQQFVSQGAVDLAATNVQTQSAAAAASRAAVQAAEVSLSLMTIQAPQPGRLGAIPVHPGAYVSPTGPALTHISDGQTVLVAFSIPQRHLAAAVAAQRSGARVVEVRAADGVSSSGPNTAKPMAPVVFVDNSVDAATGTVRLKAELDNPDGRWWPGAYVRVHLRLQTLDKATTVPLAAIVQGARGRTVFVVDEQGQAQPKPVELLESADGWAAVKGIAAGDRVVLDGRQNLRAGSPVVERSAGGGK